MQFLDTSKQGGKMVCIFCGKENDDSAKKCRYCGYVFEEVHDKDSTCNSNNNELNLKESQVDIIHSNNNYFKDKQVSEKIDDSTESETTYKWKITHETRKEPTHKDTKKNEAIISAILYVIVIGIIMYGLIVHGSLKALFEIECQIALGIVGVIAFISCGVFEGILPGTLKGTILRTFFLLMAWEIPNIVTIPLYLIVIIISIYNLYLKFYGRRQGFLLGLISILCLPFLGIFIAVIVGLFLRELSASKKKKYSR